MRIRQWGLLATTAMFVMVATPALAIEMLAPEKQEALKKCLDKNQFKPVGKLTPEQSAVLGKCYDTVVPPKPVAAVKPADVKAIDAKDKKILKEKPADAADKKEAAKPEAAKVKAKAKAKTEEEKSGTAN